MNKIVKTAIFVIIINCVAGLYGQTINRYGTTAANFLEIGIGSGPSAMGEAYVAVANDVSSIYWNPAGLGPCLKSWDFDHDFRCLKTKK